MLPSDFSDRSADNMSTGSSGNANASGSTKQAESEGGSRLASRVRARSAAPRATRNQPAANPTSDATKGRCFALSALWSQTWDVRQCDGRARTCRS